MSIGNLTVSFVCVKLLLHAVLIDRYGLHADELYFIECARRLAVGYVDHGPLVVWLAWISEVLFGPGLPGLRIASVLAGGLALWVTLQLVREFGGGKPAVILTGIAMLLAPAYLRMSTILHIPAFELLFWSLGVYLTVRIVKRNQGERGARTMEWLLLGLVAGLGLLAKITIVLWAGGLLLGLLVTGRGRLLLDWRPFAAGLTALAIFAPSLVWQFANDFPTLEFTRGLRAGLVEQIPRVIFLGAQILYIGPAALPVWLMGLVWLARRYAYLAVMFAVVLGALLVTGGKPYYPAAAYPALLAAGGVYWEERWRKWQRPGRRAASVGALILLGPGMFFAVLSLPALTLPATNRTIGAVLGAVVPPRDLTHDMHLEYGWPELAAKAGEILRAMPSPERERTALLARSYAAASALNYYGTALPHAHAPHMNYYLWGPPPEEASVVLAFGYDRSELEQLCAEVEAAGSWSHPLALPVFQEQEFFFCRGRRAAWRTLWPHMKRFDFRGDPLRFPAHRSVSSRYQSKR